MTKAENYTPNGEKLVEKHHTYNSEILSQTHNEVCVVHAKKKPIRTHTLFCTKNKIIISGKNNN